MLSDETSAVMRRAALLVLVAAAFVSFPLSADPYQPARAALMAAALLVAVLVSAGRPARSLSPVPMAVLGFLSLWTVISALSAHPASSVWGVHGRYQGLVSFALLVAAGLAGYLLFERDARFLLLFASGAAAAQGVFVVYQALRGMEPVGTIGNEVLLGSWLAVTTAASLAGFRLEKSTMRWWFLVASSLGAIALGAAGSRGAWVGLVAAMLFVMVTTGLRKAWPLLVVAALVVVVALASGGEAAEKVSPASLMKGSAASRWEIWGSTAAMIGDRPLLGVGPGRFLYEFPAYQSPEHVRLEGPDVRPDQAHSLLLQSAAESGLPAAVALLVLAGLALAAAFRGMRSGDAASLVAGAMLAAYLGQGIFGIGAVETDVLGWVAGGIALARVGAPRISGRRISLLALGAISVAVLAASVFYIRADIMYESGLQDFSRADLSGAYTAYESAVEADPLVDVYRVGVADAALFLGGDTVVSALDTVGVGLDSEPASYDLALARARLLRAMEGESADVVDAYLDAVALYPLGVEVRLETAEVLMAAGRSGEAEEMAEDVLEVLPDDARVLELLDGIHDRP